MPTDSASPEPNAFDVAPNGYFFGGLSLELLGTLERLTARYTIGATGDLSKGDVGYNWFGQTGSWSHAAEGEIAQNLWFTWERNWFTGSPAPTGGHLSDISTSATTALGERAVKQSLSGTVRLGHLAGPLPGTRSVGARKPPPWEAYVYGTVGMDLVLHDTLIDGPIFNDTPHPYQVRSRPFVPTGEIGVRVSPVSTVALSYSLRARGREVEVTAEIPTASPPSHVTGSFELNLSF